MTTSVPKKCRFCDWPLGVALTATELDVEEVHADPDADAILRSIQKFEQSKPERG